MDRYQSGSNFAGYTIEGLVAGGGMGQVYAAKHEVYGTPVALKVLHPRLHADASWMKRFSVEGLVGTRLKHPNILSARELVSHNGRIALVMDLVKGGQTLEKVISREHRTGLNLVQGLKVFLQIVQGVEYLHNKSIVHGDMKPENVLITGDYKNSDLWTALVTDFGTVTLIADPVTIDGKPAVVATPRYASPEHLYGIDKVTEISDIYALGLVLHFILTGQHPSSAKNVEEAAMFVRRPLPEVALVDQPDSLIALYKKACARDPEDRFETVRDLALAVREILEESGEKLELGEDLAADLATEIDEEMAERKREAEVAAEKAASGEGGALSEEDLDQPPNASHTQMQTEIDAGPPVMDNATTAEGLPMITPEPEDMPLVDGEGVSPPPKVETPKPADPRPEPEAEAASAEAEPAEPKPPAPEAPKAAAKAPKAAPEPAVPADLVDPAAPMPVWLWGVVAGVVLFLLWVVYLSWV